MAPEPFRHPYLPTTPEQREEMLRVIGVASVEELFADIPEAYRDPRLDLPPALSEMEVRWELEALARENITPGEYACFLGGGAARHFIPSTVKALTSRGEFLTSYTPYQPEVSQGTLQATYEFQSLVCLLTGMEVANAGMYEGASALAKEAHGAGALLVVAADPVALGLLRPPGEYGADIVAGEMGYLSAGLTFGGPYVGILACRERFLRQMPGRIVGRTVDRRARTGYVLTLQAREQHIRRERATSNICTSEALIATGAAIYLAALGRQGLRRVAELCYHKAHYAASLSARLPGYSLHPVRNGRVWHGPEGPLFFKEFVVRCPRRPGEVLQHLLARRILGGIDVSQQVPNGLLVCVTEMNTREEIEALVKALGELAREG